MSRENVELVREMQDGWNRGETAVRRDAWHPDVEFLPLRSATEGEYRGLSGIEAFVTDTLAVFEKFEMNYEYAELGDRVLAWGSIHLRARGSGLETVIETGGLFDFRDGKIVRWEDFGSKEKALEAAGLSEQAMSQENVELVRRGIQSVEAFWALLDEHVVWDLRAYPVLDLDGVYVGRDAVIEACRHYWGTWDDYRLDAEELIDAGSSVVVVVRERGQGKGSGAPFEQRFAQVWTFRRGRIIRWELFPDKAAALEAAGLEE